MPRLQKWSGTISGLKGDILVNYGPCSLTALMQAIEAHVREINSPDTLTIKVWKV